MSEENLKITADIINEYLSASMYKPKTHIKSTVNTVTETLYDSVLTENTLPDYAYSITIGCTIGPTTLLHKLHCDYPELQKIYTDIIANYPPNLQFPVCITVDESVKYLHWLRKLMQLIFKTQYNIELKYEDIKVTATYVTSLFGLYHRHYSGDDNVSSNTALLDTPPLTLRIFSCSTFTEFVSMLEQFLDVAVHSQFISDISLTVSPNEEIEYCANNGYYIDSVLNHPSQYVKHITGMKYMLSIHTHGTVYDDEYEYYVQCVQTDDMYLKIQNTRNILIYSKSKQHLDKIHTALSLLNNTADIYIVPYVLVDQNGVPLAE